MTTQGKILVIDDSEVILERIRAALGAAGYEVIATSQTVGNARHLKTCDLVILDFHMPGIDGADVLQGLRQASGGNASCLFYLYTSDDRVADDYARLGFDGSFRHKGAESSLVAQVGAVFRMRKMAALSGRPGPGNNR